MSFELPPLPYARDALAPHISAETIDFHYGKHHQTYVNNLNKLVANTAFADQSLEDIILATKEGPIFNNAAQIWNHTFYWHSLSPNAKKQPEGALLTAIQKQFSSFESFQEKFTQSAISLFGSGWTWLVQNTDGNLAICNTINADTPLCHGQTPLLTCDVWEHAYYIDHRNARPQYLTHYWALVNWDFAESNYTLF